MSVKKESDRSGLGARPWCALGLLGLAALAGCHGRSSHGETGSKGQQLAAQGEGTTAPAAEKQADLVVVAPHPDDEVLLAAGLMASRRAAGQTVAVIVVTNGDFTCERDGYVRQDESVRAVGLLGIPEKDVHFLGYPDGHLQDLSAEPLPPVPRRDAEGRCTSGNTTYGRRGHGGADEHTVRTGSPAVYTSTALVSDLAALFARLHPREIVVPHPIDAHPDHAMTYDYVRRAFDKLSFAPERILRGVVHAGPCWPDRVSPGTGCQADIFHPEAPLPPLPEPLAAYTPAVRFPVPLSMRSAVPAENVKMRAIAVYRSQTGERPSEDWLASFARSDEAFWPEYWTLDASNGGHRWVRSPDGPVEVAAVSDRARGLSSPHLSTVRRSLRFEPNAAPLSFVFTPGRGASSDGSSSSYRVTFDGKERTISLARVEAKDRRDKPEPEPFRSWGAPAATFSGTHAVELSLDPRADEGVAEISLWLDGNLLGVAVDALPTPGNMKQASGTVTALSR